MRDQSCMADLNDFKSSVALVVSSCDAFFDAWRPFYAFLEKFWGDCPLDGFLVTNELEVRSSRIRSIAVGEDRGWSSNLLCALTQIAHPYVLYFQEDYFLTAPIDRAHLADDFAQVMESGAASLCFRARSERDAGFQPLNDRYGIVPLHSDGRTRCQVTLWKRSALQSILRAEGRNGVEFRSARLAPAHRKCRFSPYRSRENAPIRYLMSAISRGPGCRKRSRLCRAHEVPIDPFFRPIFPALMAAASLRRANRAFPAPACPGRARERRDHPGMRRLVRWNLSSRARQLAGGDAIVVSIPEERPHLGPDLPCAYFCEKIGQPFTLEPEKYDGVPQIIYTHDLFEQRTKADRWDELRGKYSDPPTRHAPAGLSSCWLVRSARRLRFALHSADPPDQRETPDELKQMSASELLRDPAFGIESMVEIMNSWLAEWSDRSDFLLLRYEGLQERPRAGSFVDFAGPRRTALEEKAFPTRSSSPISGT